MSNQTFHFLIKLMINDNPFGDWEPETELEKDAEIVRKVNKLVKEELISILNSKQ